jgi:hypothetical protein
MSSVLASIRLWHTYLGILIAPSVLFFALTGALQLFGLHEARGDYQPPPLIEKLGMLHKDQVFKQRERHGPPKPPAASPGAAATGEHPPGPPADDDDGTQLSTLLLKWFFLMVAVGLATSTALGLWMGLTHIRHKRVGWVLLLFGVLLPMSLILGGG